MRHRSAATPLRLAALASVVVVLAACGRRSTATDALDEDLKRDLDIVGGSRPELASSVTRARGPQVVSEIESVPLSSRAPRVVKRHHPSPRIAPVPTRVAARDEPADAKAQPQREVESAILAPPSAAPRPVPVPVSYPTSAPEVAIGGADRGDGGSSVAEGVGGIIGAILRGGGGSDGVVIRGGRTGRDRCDPRVHSPIPMSVGGINISSRYPAIGRGTF
ncbi:MAG: hypothetical protein NVS1B4_14330 [Gemmatimonadaceae bacterium]